MWVLSQFSHLAADNLLLLLLLPFNGLFNAADNLIESNGFQHWIKRNRIVFFFGESPITNTHKIYCQHHVTYTSTGHFPHWPGARQIRSVFFYSVCLLKKTTFWDKRHKFFNRREVTPTNQPTAYQQNKPLTAAWENQPLAVIISSSKVRLPFSLLTRKFKAIILRQTHRNTYTNTQPNSWPSLSQKIAYTDKQTYTHRSRHSHTVHTYILTVNICIDHHSSAVLLTQSISWQHSQISYTHKLIHMNIILQLKITPTHTHTHTRLTALCPGLPGWAGTRKVKPIWILLKQETVSGSGISWAICKSASRSRQITMPAPHHSVFLRAGCPFCHPTNSVKAQKGIAHNKMQQNIQYCTVYLHK